ncbi:MAG: cytochrome c [Pseudomonadota bacterium]
MPIVVVLAVLAGAAGFGYGVLVLWPIDAGAAIESSRKGDPARGAYLARASGCIGCHTDIDGGGKPLAGGAALDTDFGTFYAPNITSDPNVGIGSWSLVDFARAVRKGISPDGEPYYPVFPYTFYSRLTDQDVADLYAAFQTVAAVGKPAPTSIIKFPFSERNGLKLWRALYWSDTSFQGDPVRSEAFNRGKYLVEGPLHCGACHTPRNPFGARDVEHRFEGSDALPGDGSAPPITSKALADEGWTTASLAYALVSGLTPSGDAFGGLMGEVVRDSTAFLTDADRQAIAAFLMGEDPQS